MAPASWLRWRSGRVIDRLTSQATTTATPSDHHRGRQYSRRRRSASAPGAAASASRIVDHVVPERRVAALGTEGAVASSASGSTSPVRTARSA